MSTSTNYKKDFASSRAKRMEQNTLAFGKIPPQARELEEAVLGAIMLEKDKLSDVLEILQKKECFYVDAHQKIFSAIKSLIEKGQVVDLLTVTEELKRTDELDIVGGAYYLTRLTMNVITSAHVIPHSRIILEKFILRELIRICGNIVSDAYEERSEVFEILDTAETQLFEIGNSYLKNNYSSIKDILVQTMEQIAKAKEEKADITGVPSGFPKLDEITSGWQKTDLIILAARPSVGKTAFALNLAVNAALNPHDPKGVAIFSLEMSNVQLVKRLLSMVTEVRLENISRGRLEDYEFEQLSERMAPLAKAPIFLDDQPGLNIFELRAKCRRLKAKHDIQLVIIDYLQLMHGPNEKGGNREQEISKISRELKGLAKELDIPVIALSQLSRAVETRSGDKGKIPQLSDLRESGAIEQDADMVMFIYRPEYHGIENDEHGQPVDGETHINIAKHRNGRLDQVKLKAQLEYQKFIELPSFGEDFSFQMDNPNAGLRRGYDDFNSSGMSGGFETKQSKLNNMNFDSDGFSLGNNDFGSDEDAPFN